MNSPKPGRNFNNRAQFCKYLYRPGFLFALAALAVAALGCRSLAVQGDASPPIIAGPPLEAAADSAPVFLTPTPGMVFQEVSLPGETPLAVVPESTVSLAGSDAPLFLSVETAPPTLIPSPEAPFFSEPEPDLYGGYTIDYLAGRRYGGGELQVHELMGVNPGFTRYQVSYPSDGLRIYGFMNVPRGASGPFPVVIALHGYIDPAVYTTLDYTTRYADALAEAGFLVIHPNLRGYPPSESGDNLFRVGMAIDVLNLISILNDQGGKPGALEMARPGGIGLWGHSMGGGISLRVLTVSPQVRAAVLYGAMSGDEGQNFAAIGRWSNGERGAAERAVPEAELARISPSSYIDRITASISIHHGEADQMVPLEWSVSLCQRLQSLEKRVECFTYPGQPHTFNVHGNEPFQQRVIDFFERELR